MNLMNNQIQNKLNNTVMWMALDSYSETEAESSWGGSWEALGPRSPGSPCRRQESQEKQAHGAGSLPGPPTESPRPPESGRNQH